MDQIEKNIDDSGRIIARILIYTGFLTFCVGSWVMAGQVFKYFIR